MNSKPNHYFDLSHYGLIKLSGEDTLDFLQNQITADLNVLDESGWLLSSWCLPNGRVLADFIIIKQDDGVLLILPSMLKLKVIQRLSMYVLRSKVAISDASDEFALIGLVGDGIEDIISLSGRPIKSANQRLSVYAGMTVIRFWNDVPRCMLVIGMEHLKSYMNQILMACDESNRSTWSLLDIEAGIPWITEPTSEAFLPQMLNLDLISGLSFNKGCYPGQEVIARLHFRGELKRRMFLGTGSSGITPGPGDVLEHPDTGKLIGDVVDAEPTADGHYKLLAVADLSQAQSVTLRLRGIDDSAFELHPITYPES